MNLKYFLNFILLLSYTNVCGQQKGAGQIENNTQIKADSLFNIAKINYKSGDTEKSLFFFNKSLPLFENNNNYQKIGECYQNIGAIHYFDNDYSKAQIYFEKGLKAFEISKNNDGKFNMLITLGNLNYTIGNFPKSIEFYLKSLPVAEELKNEEMLGKIYFNIGGIYSKLKEFEKAKTYNEKAYSIFKKLKDERAISKIKLELGYIKLQTGKNEEALIYYKEALSLSEKVNATDIEIEILSNLGEFYTLQKDYKKALIYNNRCLALANKENNLQFKSEARISIGKVLLETKQFKEAVAKCKLGLKYAVQLKAVAEQEEACNCLYQAYKAQGKNQLALKYYEKSITLTDSLKLEETSNKLLNVEFEKQQLVDSLSFVKKQHLAEIKHKEEVAKKEKQRNMIIATLCVMMLVAGGLWYSLNFVRKSRTALKIEKDRSEELLLNILPEEIADELKENGIVKAKEYNLASIMFTDFKSFTQTAANMTPQSLVSEINECFKAFDLIAEKYKIEKIKTIGDAYMAVGGIPHPYHNASKNIVLAGLEMQEFIVNRTAENLKTQKPNFEMRLGIHAGPIVAGVVGVKKFQYDVWGDAVNTASRMESNSEPGKVNISETLYDLIKDFTEFTFEYRGEIEAKGKGKVKMYFVEKKVVEVV